MPAHHPDRPLALLGGLSPREFLTRHWQKEPLLVRGAVPDAARLIDRDTVLDLAALEEVEPRVVARRAGRWTLRPGPLPARERARPPRRDWTVLVQGVDHHQAGMAELIERFTFLPRARLDDVMVSLATPGGGVGPHFDSYDVFLIQAAGRRRWRVSAQADLALVPDLPLRILARFRPEMEWVVEPGDLLYLPPRYAHDGEAVDECITCSVGFRAPGADELAAGYLAWLEDRVAGAARYADPDLAPARHPGAIPGDMLARLRELLRGALPDGGMDEFLCAYLSEPKPHVWFEAPERPLSARAFAAAAATRGLVLAGATRLLHRGGTFFINGFSHPVDAGAAAVLRRLADTRALPAGAGIDPRALALLHQWYKDGWLAPAPPGSSARRNRP